MANSKKIITWVLVVLAVLIIAYLAVIFLKKGAVFGPDFSKFQNQPLPPPISLSGRQIYQILGDPKFTPQIAGVIIDPVNVTSGGTINVYALMFAQDLSKLPPPPPGSHVASILPKNVGGYVSIGDGLHPEIQANFATDTLPVSAFSQPYYVNASGTVIFSPAPAENSSGTIAYVFKAEVKLPADFSSANRFFISLSDAAGRMRFATINRQSSCGYPNGGDWAPLTTEECNLSYVGGVDNGNLNLSVETSLTLDAPFAVNPGKEINISGQGSLAVNLTSGGLANGFIWRSFNDKNGSVQKIGTTAPSGYYRRYLFPDPVVPPQGKFGLSESKETYSVTESDSVWPKIYQAAIDPPDVHVGNTQNLGIVVQAEAGQKIISVIAEIETDKKTINLPLTLQGETAEADILPNPYYVDGQNELAFRTPEDMKNIASLASVAKAASSPKYTYIGSWTVQDTHDTRYHTTFIVTDSSGRVNKLTLAWSDACSIPTGGNWSLATNGNCTLSTNDGVDNGTTTIGGGYTLTIQADVWFVFNPGQHITIASGGASKIAMAANAFGIQKYYIWYTDADGDQYAPTGAVMSTSTLASGVSGKTRRYNLLGSPYSGTVDCYDGNSSAYPGAGGWHTTNRGDGSFDYNCDGSSTEEYGVEGSIYCTGSVYCGDTQNGSGPANVFCANVQSAGAGGINYPYCNGGGTAPACGVASSYWNYINTCASPTLCASPAGSGLNFASSVTQACH